MAGLFTSIGKNILERLEQLQLSQTELADRIGVSKQVINKIVQGKKSINAVELSGIAEALNISIDELVRTSTDLRAEDPLLLMMGSVSKSNTKEDLSFLYHMMDEMLKIESLAK